MATGAVIARIVSQYTDKGAKAARKDIAKLGANFDKFAKRAAKSFAVAGAASAAFAVKIGKDAVEAAIGDQKSQVLLANSLRNTVGATDAAIASVEEYITKQQALLSVADDKLRPSLSALAAATGSITTAQSLQNVALDIAADKQIDLQTASVLLAKGYNGNLTALKKLFPQISAATVKSKDFETALNLVAKASGGAAAASADTLAGRLEGLKLAYGEVLETLGYALLPVITEFVGYIRDNVLPIVEQWVSANKDQIATSLKSVIDGVVNAAKQVGIFFGFIARNIKTLEVFGAVLAGIFLGTKIYAGISALIGAVTLLTTAFRGQAVAASSAAIATGFATAGVSLVAGAAAAILFYSAMKKVTGELNANTVALSSNAAGLAHLGELQSKYQIKTVNNTKTLTKEQKIAADLAAANAKKGAKAAADLILTEKELAALKKLGATVKSETDPIALRAAELNLIKQQVITQQAADFAALERLKVQLLNNEAISRYNDILTALADKVIDTQELSVLAAKWGMSKEAVLLYIQAVVGVADSKVSTAEVDLLAAKWGITKEQAALYLDFFNALNDGKLSPTEIETLGTKWGLTSTQVLAYAEVFKIANDGKITTEEVDKLAKAWGLTSVATKAYVDFILKGFGFSVSTLTSEPDAITKAWTASFGAVKSYTDIIAVGFPYDPSVLSTPNAAEGAWTAAAGAVAAYGSAASAAAAAANDAAAAATSATAAAVSAATAAATAAAATAAAAAAGITAAADAALATAKAAAEAAAQAAADAADAAGAATGSKTSKSVKGTRIDPSEIQPFAMGGIVTSPTLGMIGEAGPEAVIPLSQMGKMGTTIINVTVQGSVTSERDLTTTLRNALLMDQSNGSSITYSSAL